MNEYRAYVIVCLEDRTWYETECVYLGADEGDAKALAAIEQQVWNSLPETADVRFVHADPDTLEIEEDPDYDSNCTRCGHGTRLAGVSILVTNYWTYRCQNPECGCLNSQEGEAPAYDPNVPVLERHEWEEHEYQEGEDDEDWAEYGKWVTMETMPEADAQALMQKWLEEYNEEYRAEGGEIEGEDDGD